MGSSKKEAREIYLQSLTCHFKDQDKNHCPNQPYWAVNLNQDEVFLCDRCYGNVKKGVYGKNVILLAAIILPNA